MKYAHNTKKYMRAQRLINLRIAKVFCTTSNEALCIVANTTPIMLKIEEVVKIYNIRKWRGKQIHNIDREVDLRYWQHPADEAKFLDTDENKYRTYPSIHRWQQTTAWGRRGSSTIHWNKLSTTV